MTNLNKKFIINFDIIITCNNNIINCKVYNINQVIHASHNVFHDTVPVRAKWIFKKILILRYKLLKIKIQMKSMQVNSINRSPRWVIIPEIQIWCQIYDNKAVFILTLNLKIDLRIIQNKFR